MFAFRHILLTLFGSMICFFALKFFFDSFFHFSISTQVEKETTTCDKATGTETKRSNACQQIKINCAIERQAETAREANDDAQRKTRGDKWLIHLMPTEMKKKILKKKKQIKLKKKGKR